MILRKITKVDENVEINILTLKDPCSDIAPRQRRKKKKRERGRVLTMQLELKSIPRTTALLNLFFATTYFVSQKLNG